MQWPMFVVLTAACGRLGFDGAPAGDGGGGGGDSGTDTASAPPIPSCIDLSSTCGPLGDQPCCDSPSVVGDTFLRGYDMATDGMFTDTTRPARISSFRLDRYEVTVGRFRKFVMAGQGTQQNPPMAGAGAHATIADSGWNTAWTSSLTVNTAAFQTALKCDPIWTDTPGANDSRPVVCITWFEALAFCAWDGGFLPTEAQWLYAAGGGTEQRAYPWSSPPGNLTIDCNHANYDPGAVACSSTGPEPVGARSPVADGRWTHTDLAGNAMEWVLDWEGPYANPCIDCANLTPSAGRLGMGGANFDDAAIVRVASRYHRGPPTGRVGGVGVRCARPL